MKRVHDRFHPQGLDVVWLGAFESPESCEEWKEEYDLPFRVVPDNGGLFRRLTSGWVPWSILVGPDGVVVFSENELDEAGFSDAIAELFAETRPAPAASSTPADAIPPAAPASAADPPVRRRSGPTTTVTRPGGPSRCQLRDTAAHGPACSRAQQRRPPGCPQGMRS